MTKQGIIFDIQRFTISDGPGMRTEVFLKGCPLRCRWCVEECPADAVRQWGEVMSAADCMEIIRRDKTFYERSGGGVTLSGGEPLMQSDFAALLLKACKEEGIHTCCDTALSTEWEDVERILPFTDLIISDIKHMESSRHKEFTGVSNERILDNLRNYPMDSFSMKRDGR